MKLLCVLFIAACLALACFIFGGCVTDSEGNTRFDANGFKDGVGAAHAAWSVYDRYENPGYYRHPIP